MTLINGDIYYNKSASETKNSAAEKTQELYNNTKKQSSDLANTIRESVYTEQKSLEAKKQGSMKEWFKLKPSKVDFLSLENNLQQKDYEYGNAEFNHMIKTLLIIQNNNDNSGVKYNELTGGDFQKDSPKKIFTNICEFMKKKGIDRPINREGPYTNADFLYMVGLGQAFVILENKMERKDKSANLVSQDFGDYVFGRKTMEDINNFSDSKNKDIKTDEVKTDEVKTDEVKTDEVKTDEVKTDEVKTDEVKVDANQNELTTIEGDKKTVTTVDGDKKTIIVTEGNKETTTIIEGNEETVIKEENGKVIGITTTTIEGNKEKVVKIEIEGAKKTVTKKEKGVVTSEECYLDIRKLPQQSDIYQGGPKKPFFSIDDLKDWNIVNYDYVKEMYESMETEKNLFPETEAPKLKEFTKLWMQQIDMAVSDLLKGVDVNGQKIEFSESDVRNIINQSKEGNFLKVVTLNGKKYDLKFSIWTEEMRGAYNAGGLGDKENNIKSKYIIEPVGLIYDGISGMLNDKQIKSVKTGDRILYSEK